MDDFVLMLSAVASTEDFTTVVERFGGEKLYGDKPWLALRELIQNARDAGATPASRRARSEAVARSKAASSRFLTISARTAACLSSWMTSSRVCPSTL